MVVDGASVANELSLLIILGAKSAAGTRRQQVSNMAEMEAGIDPNAEIQQNPPNRTHRQLGKYRKTTSLVSKNTVHSLCFTWTWHSLA